MVKSSGLYRPLAAGLALTLALIGCGIFGYRFLVAADHLDPPLRTDPASDTIPDRAADIADLYLFDKTDNLVLIVTFAGPQGTTLEATYDPDLLYTLHVSNDGDPLTTEFPIAVRFGYDDNLNPGVQVSGLPGDVTIEGPVETNLGAGEILVRAGLFDDPFFFDLQGFRETRSSGDFAFDSARDFFAAQNITGIVIQIPLEQVRTGHRLIDLWAETSRFGGQL